MPVETAPQPRPAARAVPSVSVILPAYLSHSTIAATLERLRDETRGLDAEVIVVDSSPDERTAEQVERFGEVRLIRSGERLLPHGGRNRGAEVAGGGCFVFTDPDCLPERGWLRTLLAAHAAGAEIVGGSVEDAGEELLGYAIHLTKFWPWIPGGPAGRRPHLPTASMLVSRRAWDRFGPFGEDQFSADTRFCVEAGDQGTQSLFEPEAVVSHQHESDLRAFLRERRLRGGDFARMRAGRHAWSGAHRLLRAAAAPIVPTVLLGRSLRSSLRAGRLARAIPTIPLQLAGFTAWALGEATGYLEKAEPAAATVDGPPPARLLSGHLRRWRSDPLGLLAACAADPAPATRLRIARPTYVLKHPEDIRHVLVARPEDFPKSGRVSGRRGRRLSGDGMISQPSVAGEQHSRGRGAVEGLIGGRAADAYLTRIDRCAGEALAGWDDGATIDLERETTVIATTTMLSAIFGLTERDGAGPLLEGVAERRRRFAGSVTAALPRPGRPLRRDPGGFEAAIDAQLEAAIERGDVDSEADPSLLDQLARDCRRGELDTEQARRELATLALTGFKTIAAALTWALYELMRAPALRERAESALAGERPLSPRSAAEHPVARAIAEEALRLHPPSWLFTRVAAAAVELPSGTRVERGAKLFISPYLVHRLPWLWPEPLRFDPDRFAPAARRSRPRFAYFPFGGGRRICVGRAFALNEITLVLVRVLERVRLVPTGDEARHGTDLTLLPAEPIRARVQVR